LETRESAVVSVEHSEIGGAVRAVFENQRVRKQPRWIGRETDAIALACRVSDVIVPVCALGELASSDTLHRENRHAFAQARSVNKAADKAASALEVLLESLRLNFDERAQHAARASIFSFLTHGAPEGQPLAPLWPEAFRIESMLSETREVARMLSDLAVKRRKDLQGDQLNVGFADQQDLASSWGRYCIDLTGKVPSRVSDQTNSWFGRFLSRVSARRSLSAKAINTGLSHIDPKVVTFIAAQGLAKWWNKDAPADMLL
jgi:hypothetical protein